MDFFCGYLDWWANFEHGADQPYTHVLHLKTLHQDLEPEPVSQLVYCTQFQDPQVLQGKFFIAVSL